MVAPSAVAIAILVWSYPSRAAKVVVSERQSRKRDRTPRNDGLARRRRSPRDGPAGPDLHRETVHQRCPEHGEGGAIGADREGDDQQQEETEPGERGRPEVPGGCLPRYRYASSRREGVGMTPVNRGQLLLASGTLPNPARPGSGRRRETSPAQSGLGALIQDRRSLPRSHSGRWSAAGEGGATNGS